MIVAAQGVHLDAVSRDAAARLRHAFEEERPHVELQFARDAKPVVEEVEDAVAAARPRLDLEHELTVVVVGAELDLTGLHVPAERGEPEGARGHVDHPHRTVPRAR
jgi:hypothetical protein